METLRFRHSEVERLVSIIMPMRNGYRFLDKALAGINGQTYTRWELIVVEDGSNDGSEALLRDFAAKHPNNRVLYLQNEQSGGAAYSRNRAFQEAKGQFVACLDCDDYWTSSHLESGVEALEASVSDVAYSSVVMFADSDHSLVGIWGPTLPELNAFPQSLFGRNFVTPSALVVRRSVIGEIGPWSAKYLYCADYDFVMRAAMARKRFEYIGGVQCLYRKEHAEALTQRMAETIEEAVIVAESFLGMPSTRVKSCQKCLATSLSSAAKLHVVNKAERDPSAQPSRAALLYFKAWRTRPKRVKNLLHAALCALRFGVAPGFVPVDRPNLPLASPTTRSEIKHAGLAAA